MIARTTGLIAAHARDYAANELLRDGRSIHIRAIFAKALPPAGNIGMMSQSGALGIALLDHARRLGTGISSFASVGNKADVSGNDLLCYWADDAGRAATPTRLSP